MNYHDIFWQGYKSYYEGNYNPYEVDSDEFNAWLDGHDLAEDDDYVDSSY